MLNRYRSGALTLCCYGAMKLLSKFYTRSSSACNLMYTEVVCSRCGTFVYRLTILNVKQIAGCLSEDAGVGTYENKI